MNKINSYVSEVLSYIVADNKIKARIKDDLTLQLNEASRAEYIDDVITKMGEPRDVAREFMDTIYEDKSELFDEIISAHSNEAVFMKRVYEYKSKASLFGIPLVHIKLSRYGKPTVAKGIIAIGTVSIGVISIGAFPVGIISIGGIAAGFFAYGGVAIGLLLAMGGLAIGALAIGGFAVGLGAVGGLVLGEVAIGGYAKGTVAIGNKAIGDYVMNSRNISPENFEEIAVLIKSAFPKLPEWIINILKSLAEYIK